MKIGLLLCLVTLTVAQTKTKSFKGGFRGGNKDRSKRLFLPFGRNDGDSSDETEDSDSEHIVRISRQTDYGTKAPRVPMGQDPKPDFLGQSLELARSGELDMMLQNEDWQKFAHEILGLLDPVYSPESVGSPQNEFGLSNLVSPELNIPPLKREIAVDHHPKPAQAPPNVHIHIPVFLNGDYHSSKEVSIKGFHLYFSWDKNPERNASKSQSGVENGQNSSKDPKTLENDFETGNVLNQTEVPILNDTKSDEFQGLPDFSFLKADKVQSNNESVPQNGFKLFHQINDTSPNPKNIQIPFSLGLDKAKLTISPSTKTVVPIESTTPASTFSTSVLKPSQNGSEIVENKEEESEDFLFDQHKHSDNFGLFWGSTTNDEKGVSNLMKIFWSNGTLDLCPTNLSLSIFSRPVLFAHLNDWIIICGDFPSKNSSVKAETQSSTCSSYSLNNHHLIPIPNPIEPISLGSTHLGWRQKLYVIGGGTSENPSSLVQVYDQVEMKWLEGLALSYPRFGACSVLLDGIIIVLGGSAANGTSEMYDTLTGKGWDNLPNMSQTRINPGCHFVSKGILHPELEGVLVVGGNGGNESTVEFLPTSRQLLTEGNLKWQFLPSLTTGHNATRHDVMVRNQTLRIVTWKNPSGALVHAWDNGTWIEETLEDVLFDNMTLMNGSTLEIFDESLMDFEIPCLES